MSLPSYETIAALPEYHALLHKRRRLIWPLLLIISGAYYAFILLVAFDRELLAATVGGGVVSFGLWLGLGVILLTFVITGIYVYRANRELEGLIAQIQQKAKEL